MVDREELQKLGYKLKLKNVAEKDESMKAIRLLIGICRENELKNLGFQLSTLELKIIEKEVEYSGR